MSFSKKKIRKINWQKKRNVFFQILKNLSFKLFNDLLGILKIIKIKPKRNINKKRILIPILLLIIFSFFSYGSYKIITLANNFSPKEIVLSLFSQKIKTDDKNHTNFLLVGIGGENHDGGDLTDSIKVVSLDHDNKYISMISIPRDLFVYTEYGGTKINELFELKSSETNSDELGMLFLSQKIEEITGLEINYRIKIDFESFKQAVDSLGCVDINVPEAIYDPYYPKDGTYLYDPFTIKKGPQCIDGETALKYARSRYSSGGGDFDRSARQTLLIKSIKNKALSSGVLLNPKKLNDLYNTFDDNVYTDITWDEMVYLAKISSKFNSDKIKSTNINDLPHIAGGFLYAPPKEKYGGAVFLPSYCASNSCKNSDSYTEIRKFVDLFVYKQNLISEQKTIRVLNGTKTAGLASDLLFALSRYGLNVIRYGNAFDRNVQKTTIYIMPKYDEADEIINKLNFIQDEMLPILNEFLPATYITTLTSNTEYDSSVFENDAEYIIVLGEDFVEFKKTYPEFFYYWN